MSKQIDVFISHASKDKALAEKLVDLLLENGCGLTSSQILCSSLEGMGIPVGTSNFIEFLREQLQQPKLTILLLTENYFDSTFCICELGAVWGMGLPTFPLVVAPLTKSKIKGVLGVTQCVDIQESSGLDELHDKVVAALHCLNNTPRWNVKRDEFLRKAPKLISGLEKPSKVKSEDLSAALSNYEAAQTELQRKDEDIERLESLVEDLKKCKDSKQVRAVKIKHSSDESIFKDHCESIQSSLWKLKRATRLAIFWQLKGDEYRPKGTDEWNEVRDAVAEEEVFEPDEGECQPDSSHPTVAKALQNLEAFSSWLTELEQNDSSFIEDLGSDHEFPISLGNKKFWSEFLLPI